MNQSAQARIISDDYPADASVNARQQHYTTYRDDNNLRLSPPGNGAITLAQNVENANMWKEFFTGMHMLHRYFSRTTADMSSIASANIRLLHNNLHATHSYKKTLAAARQHKDEQSMLANWPLVNSSRLHSSIISLKNAGSGPAQHNLVSHICYDYFNTDGELNTEEPVSSFYYVISGKLSVTRGNNWGNSVYSKLHNRTPGETIYKTGDVLTNPQHMGDISTINAKQKNTLLLGIHLAYS